MTTKQIRWGAIAEKGIVIMLLGIISFFSVRLVNSSDRLGESVDLFKETIIKIESKQAIHEVKSEAIHEKIDSKIAINKEAINELKPIVKANEEYRLTRGGNSGTGW